MNGSLKRKIVVGAAAALAVAGGSGAIAATQLGSPRAESQAVVNDAARQLGVQPDELSAALRKALSNRVDAAVQAGRITKAEGDALKARMNSGEVPLFGAPHGHRGGFGHPGKPRLEEAASYLGLTQAQLREQLDDGKTLAQVARDRDKSVDGLIDALVAAKKEKLDAAVEAGRLSDAERDAMVVDLREHVTDLVNGRVDRGLRRFRFRGGPDGSSGPGFRDRRELGIAPAVF